MFGPSYADGCPAKSSIADAFDSLIPHLKARDVSLIAVSGAPINKLLGYRERMGWGFTWASSYQSDFNGNLAVSSGLDQMRKAIEPILDDLPPVAFRNARKAGTDIYGDMTELLPLILVVDGSDSSEYGTCRLRSIYGASDGTEPAEGAAVFH